MRIAGSSYCQIKLNQGMIFGLSKIKFNNRYITIDIENQICGCLNDMTGREVSLSSNYLYKQQDVSLLFIGNGCKKCEQETIKKFEELIKNYPCNYDRSETINHYKGEL